MAMSKSRRDYITSMARQCQLSNWSDEAMADEKAVEAAGKRFDRETRSFLKTATDPAELHLFAELWNWDGGTKEMLQLEVVSKLSNY